MTNPLDSIASILGTVLTILREAVRLFTDTGQFLSDTVGWLTQTLFPPSLQTWFLGTIGAPSTTWGASDAFATVFRAMQGPGLTIAGVAAASRLLRTTLDSRAPALHAVTDVLPRFLLTVVLIGIPGTGLSVGYVLLTFCVNASMAVATEVFRLLFSAALVDGVSPGEGWFTHLFHTIADAGHMAVAVVVGALPLLVLMLYALFLMILRTIMLGFCFATAPLCVATFAYDTNNRFLSWWSDLFIGALLTPIVFAVAISLSITLASDVVPAAVVGPILAFVVLCGGVWLAGRLVHTITWRHFSHGGAVAGFAAGVSTVLGPLHRLANVGFMAEALGANAAGDNGAINFMKQMGLASQGFNPAGGISPAMSASALHLPAPGTAPQIRASDGTPDIASVLNATGRAAVTGLEERFASSAFGAFAHTHARLIGASTRDHPAGSLSGGDRAKLAWERWPESARRDFADQYLSLWLGTASGEAELEQPVVGAADA